MEKIDLLNSLNDTVSNRLFDCYRIALDYGADAGNIAAENIMQKETLASELPKEKN